MSKPNIMCQTTPMIGARGRIILALGCGVIMTMCHELGIVVSCVMCHAAAAVKVTTIS